MDGETYLQDWDWKLPPGSGPYELRPGDVAGILKRQAAQGDGRPDLLLVLVVDLVDPGAERPGEEQPEDLADAGMSVTGREIAGDTIRLRVGRR